MSRALLVLSVVGLVITTRYAVADTNSPHGKALAVYAPRPKYTREWAEKGIVGEGVAILTVDRATGVVTEAHMAKSTGHKVLDDSALEAFRQWRFRPGTVSHVRIPIGFINYSFEKWFIQKHGYPPPKPRKDLTNQ